jgi:hypothetical protein
MPALKYLPVTHFLIPSPLPKPIWPHRISALLHLGDDVTCVSIKVLVGIVQYLVNEQMIRRPVTVNVAGDPAAFPPLGNQLLPGKIGNQILVPESHKYQSFLKKK